VGFAGSSCGCAGAWICAAIVAIDGSKFKAVNNRDKNFTSAKMQRRMGQIEESIARYLDQLDRADREEPAMAEAKTAHLKEKIEALQKEAQRQQAPDRQISLSEPDARSRATSGRGTGGSATTCRRRWIPGTT
jgi:hypothetical protein